MSERLPLTARQKKSIFTLYSKGVKPAEIAIELASLKLSARQVTNILYRAGWTKKKAEIEQAKRESAAEIVARAREETSAELEPLLRDVAVGLRADAAHLRDGWDLVEDAAGASALQRAKGLHLNRVLRFHGLDAKQDPQVSRGAAISLVFARYPEANGGSPEALAVNVTGTAIADGAAPAGDELSLEFDPDHDG